MMDSIIILRCEARRVVSSMCGVPSPPPLHLLPPPDQTYNTCSQLYLCHSFMVSDTSCAWLRVQHVFLMTCTPILSMSAPYHSMGMEGASHVLTAFSPE